MQLFSWLANQIILSQYAVISYSISVTPFSVGFCLTAVFSSVHTFNVLSRACMRLVNNFSPNLSFLSVLCSLVSQRSLFFFPPYLCFVSLLINDKFSLTSTNFPYFLMPLLQEKCERGTRLVVIYTWSMSLSFRSLKRQLKKIIIIEAKQYEFPHPFNTRKAFWRKQKYVEVCKILTSLGNLCSKLIRKQGLSLHWWQHSVLHPLLHSVLLSVT